MSDTRPGQSTESNFDRILAEILEAEEQGQKPELDRYLASFPDLAGRLREYFQDRAEFERRAPMLAPSPAAGGVPKTLAEPPGTAGGPGIPGYEILGELGRGGMGVVYKARQVSANRLVALKMILAGHFADEAEVRRFRREAEAVASLDHPNLVPIYEVGEHHGRHFYSMKLVEGGSLPQHADRFTADPRTAARLTAAVARAVHHAHQRGILHRDLKPANVLLDADGHPYVTDFGLAKRVEGDAGLTQSGAIVGTPSYMA